MSLPHLSHLQSLVIESIGARRVTGRYLRERLASHGEEKSGPSFYQLMSRMEDAELVRGEYTQKIVDGQIFKERVYEVTAEGRRALHETISFYAGLANLNGSPSYA